MKNPRKIYKYKLKEGYNAFTMPEDPKVLFVGAQGNELFVWCEVDASEFAETGCYRFIVRATGEIFELDEYGLENIYIGSAVLDNHEVWHVYY